MTSRRLTRYEDFEGALMAYGAEQGWEFEFAGEPVEPAVVFSRLGFGPGLVLAAQAELQMRGVQVHGAPADLGIEIIDDAGAMFGKRIEFKSEDLQVMEWRMLLTSQQVELLPRNGNRIALDIVPNVLALDEQQAPSASQSAELADSAIA